MLLDSIKELWFVLRKGTILSGWMDSRVHGTEPNDIEALPMTDGWWANDLCINSNTTRVCTLCFIGDVSNGYGMGLRIEQEVPRCTVSVLCG